MDLKAPRGTKDILPPESALWKEIETAVDGVAALFGYEEIRTPMFEQASLFKRSVGEETDIVSKEMYLFTDKGGEEMALRPELTASVVRAAIEHNLVTKQASCSRLYYNSAPMFRYERPQMGRQRQFHQFGIELLGASSALADLQVIEFALAVYKKLGFSNFHLKLNTLGNLSSRERWREELVKYLQFNLETLSEDSKRRLETNPLRILDSKNPADQAIVAGAPEITDYLDESDSEHFDELKALLAAAKIPFTIEPHLVRGLDYYNRTVFELTSSDLGSQDALCGGGRYDGLIEKLGGPPTPAVGFAAGVERLVLVLSKLRGGEMAAKKTDIYIVLADKGGREVGIEIASELRNAGFRVLFDLLDRSIKAQMREADKTGTRFVLVLGNDELAAGEITLKRMDTGAQERIPQQNIAARLKNP
ncbi:MAG: histidine--tRNA ligase [Bacteroidota bacterium]|nr:histidine--tRNA ligase [Bacteroidota bacterium]MDP4237628.1 histidine--tRNA ligase [Bacteroidota bacterium]